MMKHARLYCLLLLLVCNTYVNGQINASLPTNSNKTEINTVPSNGPNTMVRNIKKGSNGTVLIAASISGVFRYDGKSFTNLTTKIGSHRFWDVLEDRRGNLWFATTYTGLYYYDGKSFQHFTIFSVLVLYF